MRSAQIGIYNELKEIGMEGVHIYFEIQLDEERILADGNDVEWMYDFMDEAFAENDCYLEKIDGKKRVYARDKDNKDMGCLFLGVNEVQYANWFEDYACHFKFYIYDKEKGEMDTEEDWLEEGGFLQRRSFRAGVKEIITDMKKLRGDGPKRTFGEISDCSDAVKGLLVDTSYQCIEEDGFILFHRKDFCEYRDGMRLFSIRLERCEMPGIASLIYLMRNNDLPDSAVVAFLKPTEDNGQSVQRLIKLLRKAKKTFRAVVLDVTNTGWDERCDFTVENCFLTQRMYKNLVSALHGGRNKWKIIPEDRQMLKGILFSEEYFTANAPRRNDSEYYRECGINCFGFCLPAEGRLGNNEGVTINLLRLGWYMSKLIELSKEKL